MSQLLGRYTAIIITTIVFVVLVVGVLGLNFTMSFQTEANAEVVNIAGRQRMLSQRVAKSIGNVRSRYAERKEFEAQLAELDSASALFNRTILAFKNGGVTGSTKSGEASLKAVAKEPGINAVDQALSIWEPLYASIQELIPKLAASTEAGHQADVEIISSLARAQAYADSNINQLLKLMNDLTNYTEGLANEAANQSRTIQTAGIIASLLCFSIIMYLIFGQLRRSDKATLAARRETEQIFETVDQGLFLIGNDFKMGSEHSKALEGIFSITDLGGKDFKRFISRLVTPADLEKVERYLKLLFDPRKKDRLLKDLNPLNQLAIQVDEYGELRNKFISFSFSRVMNGKQIDGVLTSVADITKEVNLTRELEDETRRNEQQLEMISALMGADSDLLPEFLDKSNSTYAKINDLLRDPAQTTRDFKVKAESILALIHSVKGESSALGLNIISETCHQYESQIDDLMSKPRVSGDEFLSLTVMLDKLISTNEQIDSVFNAVMSNARPVANDNVVPLVDDTNQQLGRLSTDVAGRQGKQVRLSVAGFDSGSLPAAFKLDVISLASQLLRNAIAHGIEAPGERVKAHKAQQGNITLSLLDQQQNGYTLICEDDGGGFDFELLGRKAVEAGLLSLSNDDVITQKKILSLMLTNKLSSRSESDSDAGRGVGLTVVGELATKLGGKLALQTRPGLGARFTIRFPAPKQDQMKSNNEKEVA